MKLSTVSHRLANETSALKFAPPVTHCYNPLEYAYAVHKQYLTRYGSAKKEVLLVGMNPGPFGMAQTGVPFGDVKMVRDWMGISGKVDTPVGEHPKRKILGFDCPRSEVSGTRLWGWAEGRFKTPERFFKRFFVWNYCPLCFLEETGRNRTPDKLSSREREGLYEICDRALAGVIGCLEPKFVIGIGKFALKRIEAVESSNNRIVGSILHPSPASPAANRGWEKEAERGLGSLGVEIEN